MPSVPQAAEILASLGQASFVWEIAQRHASPGATMRPRCSPISRRRRWRSGADFARLIEPARSIRNDALAHAPPARAGEGVPYRIEYGVRATTSVPVIWIEETGCWFAGADGRPARAQGIVRINNERHARDEQLLKLSRHDPLTGELNRTHLIAALAEAIEEATRFRTVLRLHADRHRSSGAGQRRLRLRCRRRRDRRSRAGAFARGCAAATCSAGSPATSSA